MSELTLILPVLLHGQPFPALRSIEFDVPFIERGAAWFIETLWLFLTHDSSPVLAQVIFSFNHPYASDDPALPLLNAEQINTIDSALAAHPSRPRIWWCRGFDGPDATPDLHNFAILVERCMPKAHAASSAVVSAFTPEPWRVLGGLVEGVPYSIVVGPP
ncbi:hypothetical protein B0H17DRAFT_1191576 [Mycena rosella]|uniref:Uncharacterized protein n=1 Tax=Mycena rosella TaxID=1033263 RepID=A0AAD7GYD8_MYCRO|nr:hypothetical protein B0H17DRAFT_1191576 [Mycena rosella]